MKKYYCLLLFTLSFFTTIAVEPDTSEIKCGFDELLYAEMEDTNFTAFQKRLDFYIRQYKQQGLTIPEFQKPMIQDTMILTGFSSSCDTCFNTKAFYLIPIVVHIVHLPADSIVGVGSNISNAQVQNAIVELNKSFAAYDISDTNAFNTGIQFYLPPVGPDSNGILRYSSSSSNLSIFPTYRTDMLLNLVDSFYSLNRFINVFTVNRITGFNPNTIHKGYATMPSKNNNQAVVIQHDWMGDFNCDNNFNLHYDSRGKTLPHEVGHYFGLFHTFHEGCTEDTSGTCETNGDRCCDTPPQSGENFDCVNPLTKSCQGGIPTQPGNCMDYTLDQLACGFWFTRNQAERMHATLQLVRKGLISIDSINQWGVRHCGLAMDFKGKQNILCDPDTVTLYGLRYIDSVHYRWIVHNPNSTLIDVSGWNMHQIKFHIANQDTFDVTLIMTQNGKSDTMTRANYVMLRECIPVADTRARWYFGNNAGLLFTEDGVVPDLGAYNAQTINVRESCLSLSDSSGNLLFYGGTRMSPDGFLYNASHQIIRNDLGNPAFVKSKGISAQ